MRLKDHINKIEYFCAVAESKSIKGASKKVFVGQPQLTKVIQQLEDLLGTSLFVRSPKGVALTRAGDLLYQYGKKVLKEVDEVEFLIKSAETDLRGHLKIGTYDSIARYFFPEFLKYMNTTVPEIVLQLETGRSSNILKKIKKGEIDIGVVVGGAGSTKGISCEPIYSDYFGLYQAPAMESRFTDNLIYFDYPLNETEKAMKQFGFNQSVLCENLETVRSLTEQSIGVGLLPHRVAKQSLVASRLIPFKHPKIRSNSFDKHEIHMCHSKSGDSELRRFVVAEIKRFLQLWHNS